MRKKQLCVNYLCGGTHGFFKSVLVYSSLPSQRSTGKWQYNPAKKWRDEQEDVSRMSRNSMTLNISQWRCVAHKIHQDSSSKNAKSLPMSPVPSSANGFASVAQAWAWSGYGCDASCGGSFRWLGPRTALGMRICRASAVGLFIMSNLYIILIIQITKVWGMIARNI